METIKIPFTGINRSIDEGIANDGQCMELINARIKNGAVEPISRPIQIAKDLANVKRIFYHPIAHKILALTTQGVTVLNEDYTFSESLSSDLGNNVNDITFLGNIACFFTDTEILYEIFDGDSYRFIGSIPEIPKINILQTTRVVSICPDVMFLAGRKSSPLTDDEFMRTSQYNAVGYYDNCIDTLNKDGYMTGPCLLKYAFRTSSGEYIKESPIFLVEHNKEIDYTFKFNKSGRGDYTEVVKFRQTLPFIHRNNELANATFKDYTYEFGVLGTRLGLSFEELNLSHLKNLIISIDIFISPIEWYEKKEAKYNSLTYTTYTKTDERANEKQIMKAYQFYKVAEYSLEGKEIWKLDDWSKDNIALQEQLITSEIKHSFSAQTNYVYNSRLHLANIKYTFFKGFDYGYESLTQETDTEYILTICTTISTEQGETVVKKVTTSKQFITPFLTYPDSRAHTMTIYMAAKPISGAVGVNYKKEFPLKKHPYLDLAYYCSPSMRWRNGDDRITNDSAYYLSIYGEGESGSIVLGEKNTTYFAENVLKVSTLNNPITFPASQTYQPSTGKIIGLCSNTTALSQGQFGQHPLYVFSRDGVFAMSVGSGKIVYASQHPISRDVCINPKSIKGIDNGVVFATERGVLMINGTQVVSLSEDMDGWLPSCIESSPIIKKIAEVAKMYRTIVTNESENKEYFLSGTEFKSYLSDAESGYNYQESEIIIANKNYPYSYVYNLKSKSWTKIAFRIDSFTNKYPECYAVSSIASDLYGIFDIQNGHRSITNILLLTRPIKMGSNAHKRILQTALRGVVKRALSDLYLRGEPVLFRDEELNIFSDVGLYILGSNDTEHFTLISGKESIVDIRDLVTKMNKSKPYKYFMVALAGGVRSDVSLNYMEFIASESFANRLR